MLQTDPKPALSALRLGSWARNTDSSDLTNGPLAIPLAIGIVLVLGVLVVGPYVWVRVASRDAGEERRRQLLLRMYLSQGAVIALVAVVGFLLLKHPIG